MSDRITAFCNWTIGHGVGLNIRRSAEEVEAFPDPRFVPLDLTPQEARELAESLLAVADEADHLEARLAEVSR